MTGLTEGTLDPHNLLHSPKTATQT